MLVLSHTEIQHYIYHHSINLVLVVKCMTSSKIGLRSGQNRLRNKYYVMGRVKLGRAHFSRRMQPASNFHVTRWWSLQPPVAGFWGPSTSSIDWCESNYAVTHYIAEFTNTLSNLIFISWALYGWKKCREQKLPLSLALCQVGVASIGIGSFLFHATLKYEWQLGDELPMIFCCAFVTYVAFDTNSNNQPPTRFIRYLPYCLLFYALGVTAVYLKYPNPVFHQVAFGLLHCLATARGMMATLTAPMTTDRERQNKKEAIRYQLAGTLTFLAGFLIWNVDNVFCDQISELKESLGMPRSFMLEGHAWWHLATGTGTYLGIIGCHLISMSLKEGADEVEVRRGGLLELWPYVARRSIKDDRKDR